MKVAYISTANLPSRYANTVHIMKMTNAIVENGHQTILIAPYLRKNIFKKNSEIHKYYGTSGKVKIVRIPMLPTMMGYYLYSFLCTLYCMLIRPDICFGRALIPIYYIAKSGVKVIYESHMPENQAPKIHSFFLKLLENPNLKHIVLISDALKNIFVDIYGKEELYLVAHDGADVNTAIATKLDDNNKFSIGYTGHLYKGRGIDIIINLSKRCTWANFHIIGGNEDDITFWKNQTKGLSNIIFHGFKPPKEIPSILKGFDILLAPYQAKVTVLNKGNTATWMSPLKIFEYMATEKPIVCSDIPVLREVLKQDYNCLLCKANDVNEWVEALTRLKNDQKLRTEISKNALNDIVSEYSWKNRAKKILEV